MELNDYQQQAMTTCMPSSNNLVYMTWNLSGEVGELCGKLAKAMRKSKLHVSTMPLNENNERLHNHTLELSDEEMEELRKECGDVLWQLSGVCSVLGLKLDDVARENLAKLASRKSRGVIDGNGDSR